MVLLIRKIIKIITWENKNNKFPLPISLKLSAQQMIRKVKNYLSCIVTEKYLMQILICAL